jgi:hypothetical protein
MMTSDNFADDYVEARRKFIAAAAGAGAALESHQAPAPGPRGEALFTDVARIGAPDAPKRLVISSGLHGVEGYCGSGCQVALLAGGVAGLLPADLTMILVHGIDPYGFCHLRRFDADNVDLNRNFLDHGEPHPLNPGYEQLRDVLCPETWTDRTQAALAQARARHAARHGLEAWREAASGGQYSDPKGIFFGGHRPSWSRHMLIDVLTRHLAGAHQVAMVDIHTGIGAKGERVDFCMSPPGGPERRLAAAWLGTAVRGPTPGRHGGLQRRGLMLPFVAQRALAPRFLPLGFEIGTYTQEETLETIVAENWMHWHGQRANRQGREITAAIREAFYPAGNVWRRACIEAAQDFFVRVIRGLANWRADG